MIPSPSHEVLDGAETDSVLDDPSLPASGHGNDRCADLIIKAFGN